MSLLRNGIRSAFALRSSASGLGSPPFLLQSANHFSTEAGRPLSPASAPANPSVDPFLQNPGTAYGKLFGNTRHTLKTDIINMLEGCDLGLEDIKFNYTRSYGPVAVLLQFPSRQAYDNAFKVIAKKGRLYRLQMANRSEWDLQQPFYGKTVLVQGVPPNAQLDDIERFLSGFDFDSSSIQFIRQGMPPNSIRTAVVKFASQVQAMNALISKNGAFCLNNRVVMRVIQ
ncbi:unnamed protein product [Linum tenue]|uniref:RRM domain-containing protein n=1 Tax=Linum tenue TaxID=586396 RepID=A0AAV0PLV1_9ROSI|nr:unnamed protein product [Linum tenue]